MPKALPALVCLIAMLAAACGGGGGGGGAASSPPPPPPPPPPTGTPDPTLVNKERPVSAQIFCANGLAVRAAASSIDRFDSTAATLGIDHWHNVEPARWGPGNDAFEGAMRTAAVVSGDFNGDCWPDLVFTSGAVTAGQLLRYDNAAGNGFTQRSLDAGAAAKLIAGLGAADLDGDYRPDLVLGHLLPGATEIYLAAADGTYALRQSIAMAKSTFGFAFGDYNGDGRPDAFAAHWDRAPLAGAAPVVLRNSGAGAGDLLFDADASAGTTVASLPQDFHFAPGFVDLDRDGLPDLLVGADNAGSVALRNTGTSAFSPLADGVLFTAANAAGAAIADFDNDGYQDWFVTGVTQPADGRPWPWGDTGNQLHWGQAASPFLGAADPAAGVGDADWPFGVCAADFNNDGLTDLFVENGMGYAPPGVVPLLDDPSVANEMSNLLADRHFTRARLFINQGNRSFADESVAWGIAELTAGRGVACLDYDRDGDIDIAVAQSARPAVFHENRHSAADGGHFVAVRLTSGPPNTFAVGALVTVEAGGMTQHRQMAANSNFLGQNSLELHFGLGAAASIDRITVAWPDGTVSSYTDLAPNRFYSLLDPGFAAYAGSPRLAEVDAALRDTLAAVASQPSLLPDDAMAGLGMVQRIQGFDLPWSVADLLRAREQQYEAMGQSDRAAAVRAALGLVVEGNVLDSADLALMIGLNAVTMRAIYCHQYPFDDAYVASLEATVPAGGYDTTHALLALMLAFDNDCAWPASFDLGIFDETVRAVYDVAAAGAIATDLRVEALTFLAAVGRHDLIRPEWLAQVLDAQRPDGLWGEAPGDPDPSGHTSSIAIWFLNEILSRGIVTSGFVAQTWDP